MAEALKYDTMQHIGPGRYSNQIGRGSRYANDFFLGSSNSKTLAEASMKSLKLFRRACRMIPWVIAYNNMTTLTNHHAAKQQLARFWRVNGKIRDIQQIDQLVMKGYEGIGNFHTADVWDSQIWDYLCPQGRGQVGSFQGYAYQDKNFAKKSKFLKSFYKGKPEKPVY